MPLEPQTGRQGQRAPFRWDEDPRTWFAADKSGFHILHTLFQTSIKYPTIKRFDEHFCLDLIVEDGRVQGVVTFDIQNGITRFIQAKSVVPATGGAGRVYRYNTNGGIVTGDGMALAYRHGVPLRDMEFVQYHPTGLPGTGILMTEGCRGEGGILLNKDGYRYLQRLRSGPGNPGRPAKEQAHGAGSARPSLPGLLAGAAKGRVIQGPMGDVVHLDLRHLGEKYLKERLPFICELAKAYVGVDPVKEPIPVRPTAHYTHGWHRNRRQVRHSSGRSLCRWRMCLRRSARRQPSGFQLPVRDRGLRQGGR